jgi:hypothetical protein
MPALPRSPTTGDLDLPPPPPDRVLDKVRRRWRSRGQHRGLRYWTLFRGIPILLGYAALYLANGLMIGWRQAYDVNIGVTSPAATTSPALAWVLSLAGWLVAPGIAGAVAGFVISSYIASRRQTPVSRLFTSDDDG